MIIISRHKNESLIFNDDIIVTVVEVRGDKVRLGLELPKDVTLYRGENYEELQRLKQIPAQDKPSSPEADA